MGNHNTIGTLRQQLSAVSDYLSVPRSIREEMGSDLVWEHVHTLAVEGSPGRKLIDARLRGLVRDMRRAQLDIRRTKRDTEERQEAILVARDLEREVDAYLRETEQAD